MSGAHKCCLSLLCYLNANPLYLSFQSSNPPDIMIYPWLCYAIFLENTSQNGAAHGGYTGTHTETLNTVREFCFPCTGDM